VYIADDTTNPDNAGVMERMYNLHHTLGDVGPFQSNTTSKWSDLLAAHQTTLNTVTGAMDTCHASIYALEARIDKLKAALDKIVGPIPVGTACTNGVTYTPPVSSNDLVGTFACLA
jgi:capsule polysaccharide export protein KpsE/RkpR